ncbi:hypothetical protein EMPS_01298 [Entomortierella parvispora]|uniref:DUF4460 domain-containing protein n=1 Tax=Entomortierella parvispora TaxID=205924 RepID=A0A9P3H2P5_9FUNG|nr:hypothetical protein EMPS_01298 [Entomortierella parvispora]
MRAPQLLKQSAGEIRQVYLQQYLKLFLRRVHPDLFQHHPKEQLQNSNSLQDLLPLVHAVKDPSLNPARPSTSKADSNTAKLLFYYREKMAPSATDSSKSTSAELVAVEHTLPLINTKISTDQESSGNVKAEALERELKSWEMVQSFLGLCQKVGVPIKGSDQEEIDRLVQESKEATKKSHARGRVPQKPLGEIFQEELQNSFSGSAGHVGARSTLDDISTQANLGKMAGSVPVLDAQSMIRSNPLLFKSPDMSKAKLSKLVRRWIHWQEEDLGESQKPFRLGHWWRKVPVMVLATAHERKEVLARSTSQGPNEPSAKGMLIVDQEMSKQEMVDYLETHLDSVQAHYKDLLLRAASSSRH